MRPPYEKLFTRDYFSTDHLLHRTMKAKISANLAHEDQVQLCIIQVYVLRKARPPAAITYTIHNMRHIGFSFSNGKDKCSINRLTCTSILRHGNWARSRAYLPRYLECSACCGQGTVEMAVTRSGSRRALLLQVIYSIFHRYQDGLIR